MRGRRHLTERERWYVEKQLKLKVSVAEIARALNCTRKTVYNEIKRGTVLQTDGTKDFYAYDYYAGQRVHDERKKRKGAKRKLSRDDPWLKSVANWILKERYSPQAARYRCGRKLCVTSVYNYVHAGLVPGVTINSLPYARPKKKKRINHGKRKFDKGPSIELRPEEAGDRNVFGHWEMDTVYSSRDDLHCLLVLTERKTREEIIVRMKDRTARSAVRAVDALERRIGAPAFRRKFKTITCDNGMEFSAWKLIERSCLTKRARTETYFCHPYSSWERGSNENANKMIRRWIPKGDDVGLWSAKEIQRIQDWINDYPRPMFNGLSSREYAASLTR